MIPETQKTNEMNRTIDLAYCLKKLRATTQREGILAEPVDNLSQRELGYGETQTAGIRKTEHRREEA